MNGFNGHKQFNPCMISIAVLSLIGAWATSFPVEGQLLNSFPIEYSIEPFKLTVYALVAQAAGLISGGILIRSARVAKHFIMAGIPFCILCTALFFFPPSSLWIVALIANSVVSSASIAAWGHFYRYCSGRSRRINTAASILIMASLLNVFIIIFMQYLSLYAGLALSMAILGAAWIFTIKLPEKTESVRPAITGISWKKRVLALLLLFMFILLVTINSGIMFQYVRPAYQGIEWLDAWYGLLPFVAAMLVIMRVPNSIDRGNALYVAIGIIGLAFVLFLLTPHTVGYYLLVYALMMGGLAVCHLFWWSMLGEILETVKNPALIFGIGFSAYILGVLHGRLIGISDIPMVSNGHFVAALGVLCVSLIILPILHRALSLMLKSDNATEQAAQEQRPDVSVTVTNTEMLTEREKQIAELMLKGRTCKMIASELYLSENTVKTHIKNIYAKLGVRRKSELFIKLNE